MVRRFVKDMKRYIPYVLYASKSDLKSEVANSHLNWLWWILDPLCFMLVYIFIALVVFRRTTPYFPVFVFSGLIIWYFFSRNIRASVTMVRSNKSIIKKIYVPKHVLILENMLVQLFKFLVSCGLLIVLIIIYQVPLSLNILYVFPVFIVILMLTYGLACILMHFGVFVEDISNIINVLLRLMMYLSGIFYSIRDRVPEPYNMILLRGNPMAFCMDAVRSALLEQKAPDFLVLGIWFAIGLLLCLIGLKLIYKYENSYAKVI
ncbi:MAG: ABC transporter permease [Christensenellales bacterium]|jgi:teichoic acid transport system permease protein